MKVAETQSRPEGQISLSNRLDSKASIWHVGDVALLVESDVVVSAVCFCPDCVKGFLEGAS